MNIYNIKKNYYINYKKLYILEIILLVTIDVWITSVSHQIIIRVVLIVIGHFGTIIASVAKSVAVRVTLVVILNFDAIILRIYNAYIHER